jgi:hypothetical protein
MMMGGDHGLWSDDDNDDDSDHDDDVDDDNGIIEI